MVFFNFETGISEASSRCDVVFKECKIENDVSFCSNRDLLGDAFVLSKICKFGIYDEATLRLHLAFEGRHGNLKGGWIKNKTKWISEDDAKSSKIFVEIYFV